MNVTGLLLSIKTQSTVLLHVLTVSSEPVDSDVPSEIVLGQEQRDVAADRQIVQRGDPRDRWSIQEWRNGKRDRARTTSLDAHKNGGTRKERQEVDALVITTSTPKRVLGGRAEINCNGRGLSSACPSTCHCYACHA